jgi:hypothetical protein
MVEQLHQPLAITVLVPSEECRSCGRKLTDPDSIARGVGTECWAGVTALIDYLNGIPLTGVILPKGQGDLVDRVRALIDAGSRAREA